MSQKEITSVDSEDALNNELKKYGEKIVIVDFYANWCGPCRQIAPKLKTINNDPDLDVVVLKVDADECEDLAAKYGVGALPTFIFFIGENKVKEVVGASEDAVRKAIEELKCAKAKK